MAISRRVVGRVVASLVLAVALAVTSTAALASTTLVAVEPGNGETLDRPPGEVVLTFADELDAGRASATLAAPGQSAREVPAEVRGSELVVQVLATGSGDYVVEYSVASVDAEPDDGVVTGSVGFSVGTEEPEDVGGTLPWAVASLVAVLGALLALLLTIRRWQALR